MNEFVKIKAVPTPNVEIQVAPARIKLLPVNRSKRILIHATPTANVNVHMIPPKIGLTLGSSGDMPVILQGTETYEGEYEVIPTFDRQVLETKNKFMENNVTVTEIPVFETSNTAGGTTVYIGKEIEIYGK